MLSIAFFILLLSNPINSYPVLDDYEVVNHGSISSIENLSGSERPNGNSETSRYSGEIPASGSFRKSRTSYTSASSDAFVSTIDNTFSLSLPENSQVLSEMLSNIQLNDFTERLSFQDSINSGQLRVILSKYFSNENVLSLAIDKFDPRDNDFSYLEYKNRVFYYTNIRPDLWRSSLGRFFRKLSQKLGYEDGVTHETPETSPTQKPLTQHQQLRPNKIPSPRIASPRIHIPINPKAI